ncbi:MAG: flagellar hook-length control protein FliK, partial [Thermoguttaceae bacterium]
IEQNQSSAVIATPELLPDPKTVRQKLSSRNQTTETQPAQMLNAALALPESQDNGQRTPQVNAATLQTVVNVPPLSPQTLTPEKLDQKSETSSTNEREVSANLGLGLKSAGTKSSVANQPADTTGSHIAAGKFLQRVEQAFAAMQSRGGTVRLKLSPPELGSLRLAISVHNGTMNARIETETKTAKNLLLQNLSTLRDRLAQQNIKIQQFEVNYNDSSLGGSAQQADQQFYAPRGQERNSYQQTQPADRGDANSLEAPAIHITHHPGQLNVIV